MNTTATTSVDSPRRVGRSLRVIVVAFLVTVAAVLQAPGASAVQYYGGTGWYGGVTPYKISHYDHWTTGPGAVVMAGLLVGGPVVSRSNGSVGAQKVEISYVITRYQPTGWTSAEQVTQWYWIPAGVSQVKLPDLRRSAGASGGKFNVRFGLAWYDSADRWLGGRAVNYNGTTNDYACTYSHYVGCTVYQGAMWIGSSR